MPFGLLDHDYKRLSPSEKNKQSTFWRGLSHEEMQKLTGMKGGTTSQMSNPSQHGGHSGVSGPGIEVKAVGNRAQQRAMGTGGVSHVTRVQENQTSGGVTVTEDKRDEHRKRVSEKTKEELRRDNLSEGKGKYSMADFQRLSAGFNKATTDESEEFDTNNDGKLDFTDFLQFAKRFEGDPSQLDLNAVNPNAAQPDPNLRAGTDFQQGQQGGGDQGQAGGTGPLDPVARYTAIDPVRTDQTNQANFVTSNQNQANLNAMNQATKQTAGDVSPFVDALKPLQDSIAGLASNPALNLQSGINAMGPNAPQSTSQLQQGFQDTLGQVNTPVIDQMNQQRAAQQTFLNDFQARQQAADSIAQLEAQQERARNANLDFQQENLLRNRMTQFDPVTGAPVDDAITQANLAAAQRQHQKSEEQTAAKLQGLGVLRGSGQPIETFGELRALQDIQDQNIRAQGQERSERAFQDSLNLLQSRRQDRGLDEDIRARGRQLGVSEGQLGLGALGEFGTTVRHGQDTALKGALGFGELLGQLPGGQQTLGGQRQQDLRAQVYGSGDPTQQAGATLGAQVAQGRVGGQDTLARDRFGLDTDKFGLDREFGTADRIGTLGGEQTLKGRGFDAATTQANRQFALDDYTQRLRADTDARLADIEERKVKHARQKDIAKGIGGIAKTALSFLPFMPSDVNMKEDIAEIAPEDVLAKLKDLPVASWRYKGKHGLGTAQHIGPMAQDFKQAFGLGNSDKTIDFVDAVGVNMAASKAIATKLDFVQKQLSSLQKKTAGK